jgi:hypothetical protein
MSSVERKEKDMLETVDGTETATFIVDRWFFPSVYELDQRLVYVWKHGVLL